MSTAAGDLPDSHTLERLPGEGRAAGAPILFIHGAFATPWVWRRNFMPWFAARGHDAFAMKLRGAGGIAGSFVEPGLQDYVDDMQTAVEAIGRQPIVVGHSLGALVAQMAIGRIPMRAMVLLAPAPPTGMFWSSVRLAVNAPGLWVRTVLSAADAGFASASATREALFSTASDATVVAETHHNLRAQPTRPLMEAQWPHHVPRAERLNIPMLTMAAEHDRLIPEDVVRRTAHYHGASHVSVGGAGHAMMLDQGWQHAAERIALWIGALS